jgi:hypothetical protein
MGATATESKQFSNISLPTGSFVLKGGKYGLAISGTITSVQLQISSLDGTFVNVGAALTAAGYANFDLVPGTYKLSGTATGLFAALTNVPT